jgi:Flp pilus assembly protein TadD
VHIGLLHLLVNMCCLSQLGFLAEGLYSGWSFLLIYILTGLAGSLASISRNSMVVTAGSSGAIFGLAGVLIASLSLGKLPIPRRDLVINVATLVIFAAYNLAFGFVKGGIDNRAHLGGLISGLVIGIFLGRDVAGRAGSLRHIAVFSITMLVLVCVFVLQREMRAQTVVIEAARQALNQGDSNLAIHQLSALARDKRAEPTVYSLLGTAYAAKDQYGEAEHYFRKALEATPNDSAVRVSLAWLYFNLGRFEASREEFAQAVKLNPKAEIGWLDLGLASQRLGQHKEAVSEFSGALSLNPKLQQAQFGLGISQMNLRNYRDAITAFRKATELSPGDYRAQIWLANAYDAAGLTSEAEVAYLKAYQLQLARQHGQTRRR